jgi:hypothetical protein
MGRRLTKQESGRNIITEDELKRLLPEIFRRAQISNEFRQLCVKNPSQAIFEVAGKNLPDGSKLSFLDE